MDYNTNLISGGAGARYLGIGTSKQYREDVVVVSLRLVSVSTGEILMEILTSKAILSVGLSKKQVNCYTSSNGNCSSRTN